MAGNPSLKGRGQLEHQPIDLVLYVVCTTRMKFGPHIRDTREARGIGLRELAGRIDVEPAYLSKIEREIFPPPSEALIVKIAAQLGDDPDRLLALAGKIPSDVKDLIIKSEGRLAQRLREWAADQSSG